MIPRLLVDLDETVADCMGSWLPQLSKSVGFKVSKEDLTSWRVSTIPKLADIPKEQIFAPTRAPGFFANLKPLPGAIEGLKVLKASGFEIIIVTSPPIDNIGTHTLPDKASWVQRHLVDIVTMEELIFARRKDLIRGDIILDDHPKHLQAFPGLTCAMDQPYNRHLTGEVDARAFGWPDAVEKVQSLKERVDADHL